jgi:amino-acid N-acetyltransferase
LIRRAKTTDVEEIADLIEEFANKGEMLHRPLTDLYSYVRDFFVYEENGVLMGTCALHVCWEDLGEVKSLAVREGIAGKGVGSKLVDTCLNEARDLALSRVFALTYRQAFFEKLGFKPIDKSVLPHKIWGECVKCFKFPNCDENAVMIYLGNSTTHHN